MPALGIRKKDTEKKEALFVAYAQNVPDIREYLTAKHLNYSARTITTTKTDYIVKKTFLKHISYSKTSKNKI